MSLQPSHISHQLAYERIEPMLRKALAADGTDAATIEGIVSALAVVLGFAADVSRAAAALERIAAAQEQLAEARYHRYPPVMPPEPTE